MFLNSVFWILIALTGLTVIKAIKGPKLWDRLLAMNLITVKGILLILIYATIEDATGFIDVALIYALFGFIATIFLALFISEHKERRGRK